MWFKNLIAYRFTSPFTLQLEELEGLLQEQLFTPCGRNDQQRSGWVSPLGKKQSSLVYQANGCLMLCLKKEEKLLPAGVIREQLDEKVEAIEAKEDRRVYRKEKESLKEEIIHECLPRAFSRSRLTYAFIAPRQGWLLVDSSSRPKAEEFTKQLRQAIGSLPVVPLDVQHSVTAIMTGWLQQHPLPQHLSLTHEGELREPGESGSILRCKHQDLLSEEIDSHLNAGKQAVKLGLDWQEQLQFILAEDFSFKRLKFAEKLVSEAEDASNGDPAAKFDADFALMSATVIDLLNQLIEAFGSVKEAV